MGSIDRYIFRTIFGAFVLILFNLTAVIWITQILKQIDLITNQGQTILVFLRITGLLVPILMLIIAPIAIMIAICYALIKLNGDSELVVMNAAGISPRRVYRPVLGACIMVAIFAWPVMTMLAELDQRSETANIPLVIPQAAVPVGLLLMALLIAVRLYLFGLRHDDAISARDVEH